MKRILILTILLMSSLAWAGSTTVVVGQGGGGESCASCTTSNDSAFVTDTISGYSNANEVIWLAYKFTTATTKCVTGAYFHCTDGGTSTGATMEIYTDAGGNPGSIVSAGYTSTVANLPDTEADVEFAFASTQTLAAGTYWMVWKCASTNVTYYYSSGGTGWKYSTDSGSSWSSSSYHRQAGVNGCDPE
jgi:hypothetical protein